MKLKLRIAKILAVPAIALTAFAGVGLISAAPAGAAQYEPENTWIQQWDGNGTGGQVGIDTYYGNYYVGFSQVYVDYVANDFAWQSCTEAINGYGQSNGEVCTAEDATGSGSIVTSTVPAGGIYYGEFWDVPIFWGTAGWEYVI